MTHQIQKELDRMNMETVSITEVEKLFSEHILGHNRPTINISTEGLFRARNVTGKDVAELATTASIWYPDFSAIEENYHRFNRCSTKGQNFFYASNFLGTTIFELNPKDEDLILVGVFHKRNPNFKFRSQFAGIEALRKNPNHKTSLETYQYPSGNDKTIEKYISAKFQEYVADHETYKYKPSIAFSNILLKNLGYSCIIYPSVASNLEYVNYGIKPEYVDEFLFCRSTYLYKIRRNESQFELIPVQYGKRIILNNKKPKNSIIEWAENSEADKKKTIQYSL